MHRLARSRGSDLRPGIGDVFVARVAGNVVGVDTAGSIEYACNYAGSKVVVVMGHTNCGAVKGAIDGVENGNLTAVLAKLGPAMEAVPDVWGERSSANAAFVDAVAEQNVRLMVDELRQISPLLGRLERTDEIVIMGAMYDVSTGRVTFLAEE